MRDYYTAIRRCILRPKIQKKWKKENTNTDVTLITQNCIGGVIYSNLGMPFLSPTINLFIEDNNFVKLIYNLPYYISLQAEAEIDCFVDPINNNIHYPKIKVGDIEICALHYKDCNEAIAAWNRRKERVNLSNVYVIGNSWNSHGSIKIINQILDCPYKSVVFVTKEIFNEESEKTKNCIILQDDFWYLDERGIVRPNITDFIPCSEYKYFEKRFDFMKWLNE